MRDTTMFYVANRGNHTDVPYRRDGPLKGHCLLSGAGVRNVAPIPGIPICVRLEYKGAWLLQLQQLNRKPAKRQREQSAGSKKNGQRNMVVSFVSICGLLLILNLPLSTSFPVLSDTDVDVLEAILHKLEESMSEETEEDQMVPANRESLEPVGSMKQTANRDQIRPVEMEAIREFLSANTRKNVQNDSSRRSGSSCFGRRMDRIGSMSSLGCNTVGKYNPK